ncbi:MAG: shikimate dehydrogenase [Armatimonadetes bacterium]|nr:shikimate dehydrogenase [Armatimonadota bacterium]
MADWREVSAEPDVELRLALLGDPVEHSLSPRMQAAAIEDMGLKATYEAYRVTADEFPECIGRLRECGFTGVNVTAPHKRAAAALGQAEDSATRMIQSANSLRLEAVIASRNTDVPGFLRPLRETCPGRALILGAGGAAAAGAYGLLRRGWRVRVWNRTPQRARELAWGLGMWGTIDDIPRPDPRGCDLIVNATSLGARKGECPPLVWDHAKPEAVAYDMAYRKGPTDFLKAAAGRVRETIDGREMLVEQGALALEWWSGRPVPREPMRKAVGL